MAFQRAKSLAQEELTKYFRRSMIGKRHYPLGRRLTTNQSRRCAASRSMKHTYVEILDFFFFPTHPCLSHGNNPTFSPNQQNQPTAADNVKWRIKVISYRKKCLSEKRVIHLAAAKGDDETDPKC